MTIILLPKSLETAMEFDNNSSEPSRYSGGANSKLYIYNHPSCLISTIRET